jgi:lipopolysaccharide export system permease protein
MGRFPCPTVVFLIPSILQRYVLREALKVALVCIVALTAMMFVGMSVSMMRRGISVVQLWGVLPYVAAFCLPYALPAACLLAAVFVFGRLSAHNEITAIRSSGVNLNHVIVPLLIVGLLVSIFTFMLNHYLLPWSLVRIKQMRERLITEVVQMVGGTYREYEVGNYLVYVGDIVNEPLPWRNVAVIEFSGEIPVRVLTAHRGICRVDEERSAAILELYEGTALQPRMGSGDKQPPVRFDATTFEIDLSAEIDFSVDRPKFLALGQLWQAMQTLKQEADEVRALPEYAKIKHPRTVRQETSKARDRAYRDYSRATRPLDAAVSKAAEARKLVEQAQSEARAARAALESSVKRLDEIKDTLARQREFEGRLRAERKPLIERNAAPSRVRENAKELQGVAGRLRDLEQRRLEAEKAVSAAEAELRPVEETLALRNAALEEASGRVAELRVKADEAAAAFNKVRAHVNNLKAMERDLRARADFHFRNAGALTALVFMLIGIPLGIISRHGNIILAFVISFFVVLIVYYPLMVIGQMLSLDGYLSPVVGEWMGNVAVGGAGIVLLIRGIRR